MITLNSAQLTALVVAFLWPFTRIMGTIMVAPLFGNVSVPSRVKVVLGVALALVIAPGLPPLPAIDPLSWSAVGMLIQQFVIGAAIGFAVRTVFAAVELAGELTGLTMGLGFATFYDPQSQGRSSAVSQFLALVTMGFYLASDLHLVLLAALADSFHAMPIERASFGNGLVLSMAQWGSRIFAAGVQISLPMVAVLLVTNVALAVLTRAAPQLNLFGIGFPVTISVGLVMIALVLPFLAQPLTQLFADVFTLIRGFR